MNKNQNRNQNQNGNRNQNKNQDQALNRNLKYTIPAVLILILELLMLSLRVSGAPARCSCAASGLPVVPAHVFRVRSAWPPARLPPRFCCCFCLCAEGNFCLQLPPLIQEMTAAPVPNASRLFSNILRQYHRQYIHRAHALRNSPISERPACR